MSEAEQERAAIVAWLRGNSAAQVRCMKNNAKAGNYDIASKAQFFAIRDDRTADSIERGEHLRANTEGDS